MKSFKKKTKINKLKIVPVESMPNGSIERADGMLHMCAIMDGSDMGEVAAILRSGVVINFIPPRHAKQLFKESKSIAITLLAHIHTQYFDRDKSHPFSAHNYKNGKPSLEYFNENKLPTTLLLDAMNMYAPLIEEDFKAYNASIKRATEEILPQQKLGKAINSGLEG